MPIAAERLRDEQAHHDRQARQRAVTFARCPDRLRFRDEDYLDHETWVRPAFDRLGDVTGKRVLDWGCGHGMAAVVLARRGAVVTALDLSAGYVREARRRASANGVAVNCVAADAARLPFADAGFDAVWGHAILHHLDVASAAAELRRVLRPGGVAVVCEPWGGNPLLRFARRWLPYPGKGRTRDERPLLPNDLELVRRSFDRLDWHGFQLVGTVRRVIGPRGRPLDRLDRLLLRRWPALRTWCRYAVLVLR